MIIKQGKTNWKYVVIILVLALIVGGGIFGYWKWVGREEVKILEIKMSEKVVENETANWETYKNEQYGFEINYPNDFVKAEWTDFEFTNIAGDFKGFFLVQFKIPRFYIKSEFYAPDIRIEVDDENICEKLNQFPDVDESLTTKIPLVINKNIFTKKEKKDANPGVSYDKIIYYTKKENRCYSITLFNIISTAGIEALADQNKIREEQNQIEKEKKNFIEFLEQKILPTFKLFNADIILK